MLGSWQGGRASRGAGSTGASLHPQTLEFGGCWLGLGFFSPLYRGKQDTVVLRPIGSFSSLIDQKLHSNYVLRTYVNCWFNFQTY